MGDALDLEYAAEQRLQLMLRISSIKLPEGSVAVVGKNEKNACLKNRVPVLQGSPVVVSGERFVAVLKEVVAAVEDVFPSLAEECRKVLSDIPSDPKKRDELAVFTIAPLGRTGVYSQREDNPYFSQVLFSLAARPFLHCFAKDNITKADLENWNEGSCPVCGRPPRIAYLTPEEGIRFLFCMDCGVQWRFRRVGCPYCGSMASQYLTVDDWPGFRLYCCDECHGYLKTLDKPLTVSEESLLKADAASLRLDLIARKEGYAGK